jgi:5-methylthioadenosine/S-adenosylhomocysteine deaminase
LATIAGAEAVGMADRIGSIEPGKQADIVIHRASGWGWSPRGDIGLQLVWGTDGRSVRDVYVAGVQVLRNGETTRVDQVAVYAAAADAQTSLLQRAGITVPHRWPYIDAR